ncbi:hypothetical protein NIIDNTM18_42190 [Mycolicibacterium litorale]|uniref:Tail terminator n=1 Tax=Mycolicibacterium litorale TaxID=758802 RepID=A0A6S6PB38_9MYCO|nr:hypothetical protein [Mycolicibacterium litorale]BCI54941.1 hypothetical protein NIIDNTM18_42190 [Mycolicibacterium litorale]
MPEVLLAPSARDLTRTYMIAELEARGFAGSSWTTTVPANRPTRFFTIEELNARDEFGVLAESQLLQIRIYDADQKRAATTARMIKALWKVMPANGEVQNVDIAGGPTYQVDPDVPNLTRYLITGWVTVMTSPE